MHTSPVEVTPEEKALAAAAAPAATPQLTIERAFLARPLELLRKFMSAHDVLERMDRKGFARDLLYDTSEECNALLYARVALQHRIEYYVERITEAGALLHIRWAS